MKTPPAPNSYIRSLLNQIDTLTAEKEAAEGQLRDTMAEFFDYAHETSKLRDSLAATQDALSRAEESPRTFAHAADVCYEAQQAAESSRAWAREEIADIQKSFHARIELHNHDLAEREAAEQREKGLVALVVKLSDIVGQPSTCDHCEEAWEAINEFNKAALAAALKEGNSAE